MPLELLNKEYDKLKKIWPKFIIGECSNNSNICFAFMNPTGRNIASSKDWHGRKSLWMDTKNIWYLFYLLNFITKEIYTKINEIKNSEWIPKFADEVYEDIINHHIFIINLGKTISMMCKLQ